MTETLIQRLRQVTIFYEGSIDGETIKEAATALEASEREIAKLEKIMALARARSDETTDTLHTRISELEGALKEIAAIDIADKGLPSARIARAALRHYKELYEAGCKTWNPVYQVVLKERDTLRTALEASEEELKLLRPVYEAARGLCHGTDWNNGNHARLHGYREKLIAATAIARATLRNRENEK
jgi:hypothetical protein